MEKQDLHIEIHQTWVENIIEIDAVQEYKYEVYLGLAVILSAIGLFFVSSLV